MTSKEIKEKNSLKENPITIDCCPASIITSSNVLVQESPLPERSGRSWWKLFLLLVVMTSCLFDILARYVSGGGSYEHFKATQHRAQSLAQELPQLVTDTRVELAKNDRNVHAKQTLSEQLSERERVRPIFALKDGWLAKYSDLEVNDYAVSSLTHKEFMKKIATEFSPVFTRVRGLSPKNAREFTSLFKTHCFNTQQNFSLQSVFGERPVFSIKW